MSSQTKSQITPTLLGIAILIVLALLCVNMGLVPPVCLKCFTTQKMVKVFTVDDGFSEGSSYPPNATNDGYVIRISSFKKQPSSTKSFKGWVCQGCSKNPQMDAHNLAVGR